MLSMGIIETNIASGHMATFRVESPSDGQNMLPDSYEKIRHQ
jgi:hypothetical protein